MRLGIVGPTYQSQSLLADAQRCINWYLERIESGRGKTDLGLYRTPGLKKFAQPGGYGLGGYGLGGYGIGQPARAIFNLQTCFGRLFGICDYPQGQELVEFFADGTFRAWRPLGGGGARASLAYNNAQQLLIASGGQLFLFDMTTNVLTEINTKDGSALQGPVAKVGFTKGFFVALLKDSQQFQVSAVEDGTSWDPTDETRPNDFPDNVLGMIVDHGEMFLLGDKQSIVYYVSGGANFPLDPVPGSFMEIGLLAPDSLTKFDNSVFWIGADERGGAMAWMAQGYHPQRVSNHAIEAEWQSYSRVDDAIGYAFQMNGHTFWHVLFPSAQKSWRYDVTVGPTAWHEVAYKDGTAHRSQCHAFAFGKHLVGDWNSGTVYEMSPKFLDDDGAEIVRTRRAVHISDEDDFLFHNELKLALNTGMGPLPPLRDGEGNPRGPVINLRWSNDGGRNWSNEHPRDAGQAGEYKKRVVWRRLGRARDRVYEITVSDPVDWAIIDGYLDVEAAVPA